MKEQNEQQQQQQQQQQQRRRRHQLDSASRSAPSAQEMMDCMLETEDRAAGSAAATATTTNNESSRTGVTDVDAPDKVSSNIEEAQRIDVPNSKDASNTCTVALPTSTVRGDDQPTKSDENLDDDQQLHRPTEHKEHTDRRSTAVIEAGHGSLLPPSSSSVLVNEVRRSAATASRRYCC